MGYRVVCGSYEHVLYGYMVEQRETHKPSRKESSSPGKEVDEIVPLFGYAAHSEAIHSVSALGDILVSGCSDSIIKAYSLKKKVEIGTLIQHDNAITCVKLTKKYMISASKDGTIVVWKIKDWRPLLSLAAHNPESGGVVSFSIHPSSKVMLSIGGDRSLKLWDMTTGKCIFLKRKVVPYHTLPSAQSHVKLSPQYAGSLFNVQWDSFEAKRYIITNGSTLFIFDGQTGELELSYSPSAEEFVEITKGLIVPANKQNKKEKQQIDKQSKKKKKNDTEDAVNEDESDDIDKKKVEELESLNLKLKCLEACFLSSTIVAVSGDSHRIVLYRLVENSTSNSVPSHTKQKGEKRKREEKKSKERFSFERIGLISGHDSKVKALQVITPKNIKSRHLVVGKSDGKIEIWAIGIEEEALKSIKPYASHGPGSDGTRFTCMTVAEAAEN